MKNVEFLRNNIIDKLLTISNIDYLTALNNIIQKPHLISTLTLEQTQMLQMSEMNIENGELYNYDQVDLEDLKWLKEL